MQVILDISANTHRNDPDEMRKLFGAIPKTDKHEIVLKTQFWSRDNPQGDNEATTFPGLGMFIDIARKSGYEATSSVFDRLAMFNFLTFFEAPFIKIACRPELYDLAQYVPRGTPIYYSESVKAGPAPLVYYEEEFDKVLACVPEYPAKFSAYKSAIDDCDGFSDHTVGRKVFDVCHEGCIYECHYVLERNSTNPDAGPFAKTPEDLREMFK